MRLIDADELKKCAIPCEIHNGALTDLCVPLYQIDNAPTVELFCAYLSDGEVRQPCVESPCEHERPQGKWLNDRVAFHFTCDYCGCNIRQLKNEVFEGDYDYNFCPNCGAKMKGGAE